MKHYSFVLTVVVLAGFQGVVMAQDQTKVLLENSRPMNDEAAAAEEETFSGRRADTAQQETKDPCAEETSSLSVPWSMFVGKAFAQEVIELRDRFAVVSQVVGDVRVQPQGHAERAAVVGDVLCEGSELFVGFDSSATVAREGQITMGIRASTQIRIAASDERRFHIKLERGEVRAQVKVTGPTRPDVRIQTPTITSSVRGTDFIVAQGDDGSAQVLVREGTVNVVHMVSGSQADISAGAKITADTSRLDDPTPLSKEDQSRFEDNPSAKSDRYSIPQLFVGSVILLLATAGWLVWRMRRKSANVRSAT